MPLAMKRLYSLSVGSKWYLEGLHAVHAKARDQHQDLTELMNLTAMEVIESVWRYEDGLLVHRKNASTALLRVQGRQVSSPREIRLLRTGNG